MTISSPKWFVLVMSMVLASAGARVSDGADTAGKRPNVLYIFTDQQFAEALSCAGNPWVKTPAMDSLAATGMRFSRAYCTHPFCSPSWASMLTGLMPHEHGVTTNSVAMRIPMIVSFKGRTRPGAVDQTHLVSNGLDLLPTLCDYVGIRSPEGLRGLSLRPLAEGQPVASWRDQVVSVCRRGSGQMVRTQRYKYPKHRLE